MNIGDKMMVLLKQKNMSQTDLGKAVGVSRKIIGRYERNEVSQKIADVLNVSLDYLAGEGKKAHFDKQTLKLVQEIEELELSLKKNSCSCLI